MKAWLVVGRLLSAGQDPYARTTILNYWPPLWGQILSLLTSVSSATGLPLLRTLQLFFIAAECVLLAVLADLLRRGSLPRTRTLLLLGICLNPVSILLVCQHGNFDILVGLTVLLFLRALLKFEETADFSHWLLACLWLGLGVTLKSVPILLSPLLISGARSVPWRARLLGFFLVIGPVAYGLSILALVHSSSLVPSILSYRSLPGWFGVTGIFHALHRDDWTLAYARIFPVALAAGAILLIVRFWRNRPTPRERLLWSVLLLISIPFLGPGYGPQYLYWFWPLLIAAAATGSRALQWSAGFFGAVACATYLAEYAVMESLGAFLVWKDPSPGFVFLSIALRSNRAAALANAPLFLAYGALFAALVLELSSIRSRGRRAAEVRVSGEL